MTFIVDFDLITDVISIYSPHQFILFVKELIVEVWRWNNCNFVVLIDILDDSLLIKSLEVRKQFSCQPMTCKLIRTSGILLCADTHVWWAVANFAVFITPLVHSWVLIIRGDSMAWARFGRSWWVGWSCWLIRVMSCCCIWVTSHYLDVRASPEGLLWSTSLTALSRVFVTSPIACTVPVPLKEILYDIFWEH